MNLSEFRKNYGKNVSMKVCKTAYGYVLNQNAPNTSVCIASIIYAQKFLNNPLKYSSFRVEKELGCIRIYKVQTETEFAQSALKRGNWNYNNRNLCIAALGENYKQKFVRTIELPDDLVVSVYEHFGRFVSVVALEGCQKQSQIMAFNDVAHVLAVNALCYYGRYFDEVSIVNKNSLNTEIGDFDKYLTSQSIEIKHNKYYNDNGFFPSSRKGERIAQYLKRKNEELGADIHIAQISIFGDDF